MGIGIGTVAVLLAGLVFFLFLTRNYKKEYFEKRSIFILLPVFFLKNVIFLSFFQIGRKSG